MKEKHKEYIMEELSIEITYKCHMRCLHCSSRAGAKSDIFIPIEDIIYMIDICATECGTECVSLSGGEPFEHDYFWDILRFIKQKGLKTIVYSCGIEGNENNFNSYSKQRINRLSDYCDKLIISLHGSKDIHNKIMDIPNAFELAINTIRNTIKKGIEVEIHFVPTKINYKSIQYVYSLCNTLGVSKMSILRYVPQGRGKENEESGTELNLNKREFMELNEDMLYLKNISNNNITSFRIGVPADFSFLIEGKDKERSCSGGKDKILVKADGLVQVCPAWKELDHLSAGNIYEEDIVNIWKEGKTYCKFREFIYSDLEDPCKPCKYVKSCLGGCSAQRIINNNKNIEDIKKAPDPLCFIDLIEDIKKPKY